MAKYSIENSTLKAIGNAIREKMGTTTLYTPAQMASVISSIQTGGTTPDFSLAMDFGTYIPSSNALGSSTYITTKLSKVFVAFLWCPSLFFDSTVNANAILSGHYNADENGFEINGRAYTKLSCYTYINKTTSNITSAQQNLQTTADNSFVIYATSAYYLAGKIYHWIAWGIPDE